MSLETQIQSDLKSAMLSKNEAALRALRAIKSAILLAKTSGALARLTPGDMCGHLSEPIRVQDDAARLNRLGR